jgi:hypothetical protein
MCSTLTTLAVLKKNIGLMVSIWDLKHSLYALTVAVTLKMPLIAASVAKRSQKTNCIPAGAKSVCVKP